MGVIFDIEHASLVGWLTRRDFPPTWPSPFPEDWHFWRHHHRHRREIQMPRWPEQPWRAPRMRQGVLSLFLEGLRESVVTRYPEDQAVLQRLASECREALGRLRQRTESIEGPSDGSSSQEVLTSTEVAQVLAPLRTWFDVPFYFMPLGGDLPMGSVRESPEYTLWLMCQDPRRGNARDLLDPFPAIRTVLATGTEASEAVTLCWNWSGDTAAIPASTMNVERLVRLSGEIHPSGLWSELKRHHREPPPPFNLLQISDLHFGAGTVSPRQVTYVEQHLRDRIEKTRGQGGVVQPVITGDLMDSPSKKNLQAFEAFRNRFEAAAGTPAICVPGNHDMKKKGFLWKNWEHLAGLEWSNLAPSDVCKVVFVCFDTSKEAKLAQGKITDDQFLEVATKVDAMRNQEKYGEHMFVTLVHHHPFSTQDDEVDTIPFLGMKEEPFLRMENGEHLVKWCAQKRIPLILHGHKHRPRFVGREVEVEGRTRLVRAIGCGSSFGIEGKPLSYNWITWQPSAKTWTVSFMADPGDGSSFAEKRLVIGPAAENV